MDQKEVWNTLAHEWRRLRSRPSWDATEFLSDKQGLILDVGCGTGRNLAKGKKYIGFDFAEKQIAYAEEKATKEGIKALFSVASAADMPFKDSSFDAVLVSNTLHTMRDREKCLKEISRVMKPNALAFISVWNKRQPRFFLKPKESMIPWKVGNASVMRYYYFFTQNELRKAVERSGLEVVKIYGSRRKALKLFPMDIIAIARKAGVPKTPFLQRKAVPKEQQRRKGCGNLV